MIRDADNILQLIHSKPQLSKIGSPVNWERS